MSETTSAKVMQARFASRCTLCGRQIRSGEWITWSREQGAQCTTATTTIGSDGRTYYGHSAQHPAIVTIERTVRTTREDVESASWTKDEDHGEHETWKLDNLDAYGI